MNKPSYGPSGIAKWKFEQHALPAPWSNHIQTLPQRFLMYIDGDDGHGKTEYTLQLSKMLSTHYGKVHLNNVEQGKHIQIQQSVERNKFEAIPAGKFMYSAITDFKAYKEKLARRNSGRVQIIDSISYWPLNAKQIQELIEDFRRKSFIFVAYKKHYHANKEIAHLCDIKVRVEHFRATPRGRFGGNENYVIWDRPKKGNIQLLIDGMDKLNGSN